MPMKGNWHWQTVKDYSRSTERTHTCHAKHWPTTTSQAMEMTQVQIRHCHCRLQMTLILQVSLVELREEMQPYLMGTSLRTHFWRVCTRGAMPFFISWITYKRSSTTVQVLGSHSACWALTHWWWRCICQRYLLSLMPAKFHLVGDCAQVTLPLSSNLAASPPTTARTKFRMDRVWGEERHPSSYSWSSWKLPEVATSLVSSVYYQLTLFNDTAGLNLLHEEACVSQNR